MDGYPDCWYFLFVSGKQTVQIEEVVTYCITGFILIDVMARSIVIYTNVFHYDLWFIDFYLNIYDFI